MGEGGPLPLPQGLQAERLQAPLADLVLLVLQVPAVRRGGDGGRVSGPWPGAGPGCSTCPPLPQTPDHGPARGAAGRKALQEEGTRKTDRQESEMRGCADT